MLIEDIENRDRFLFIFEWLMAVMSRYMCAMQFGLVHIDHGDKNELGDAYGAKDAAEQLVAMTSHLKAVFRNTDLVARIGSDFWIIVPYTPATEQVQDKVRNIMQDAAHDGLKAVGQDASVFCFPSNNQEVNQKLTELSGIEFLAYLKAHRHLLFSPLVV
ncbi:diguanylate cyclase domain-containing protein [Methylotenera mobilis]|uniref:Putative diguanylate cyclase n=1 Tax=Methylotenera mobilis (strain JLW8 / ATCC BAA-1282 / DSM 17540) TaxID=583345 RepID=C6WSQ7_METML|nr:diguanylate cyclase [Methylotenera mobilis]ACT47149.1 putative diguanylate cyclase [Methylotenera mobilis JLW8]